MEPLAPVPPVLGNFTSQIPKHFTKAGPLQDIIFAICPCLCGACRKCETDSKVKNASVWSQIRKAILHIYFGRHARRAPCSSSPRYQEIELLRFPCRHWDCGIPCQHQLLTSVSHGRMGAPTADGLLKQSREKISCWAPPARRCSSAMASCGTSTFRRRWVTAWELTAFFKEFFFFFFFFFFF